MHYTLLMPALSNFDLLPRAVILYGSFIDLQSTTITAACLILSSNRFLIFPAAWPIICSWTCGLRAEPRSDQAAGGRKHFRQLLTEGSNISHIEVICPLKSSPPPFQMYGISTEPLVMSKSNVIFQFIIEEIGNNKSSPGVFKHASNRI